MVEFVVPAEVVKQPEHLIAPMFVRLGHAQTYGFRDDIQEALRKRIDDTFFLEDLQAREREGFRDKPMLVEAAKNGTIAVHFFRLGFHIVLKIQKKGEQYYAIIQENAAPFAQKNIIPDYISRMKNVIFDVLGMQNGGNPTQEQILAGYYKVFGPVRTAQASLKGQINRNALNRALAKTRRRKSRKGRKGRTARRR